MSPHEVLALNGQIAAMARAGLPLDQGLDSLANDMGRGRLRSVTRDLAGDLRSGLPLDQALRKQSRRLPQFYAPLVAAGIRTGRLPEVLATLSHYTKSIGQLRAALSEAMIYPTIVFTFGVALIGFMGFFVLPQFQTIFAEFGIRIPWVTRVVLSIADAPLIVGGVFLAVLLAIIGLVVASRVSPAARYTIARGFYGIPLVGTVVRSARLAAFAELLAILVEFEVPMPEAFRIAGQASPDPVMARQADRVIKDLEHGTSLAGALTGRGLVPEWMSWMAGAGIKHGQLAAALGQVATVYRRQVESRIAILRSVLPSFIIIITAGTVVLLFGLAVIVPMMHLIIGLSI